MIHHPLGGAQGQASDIEITAKQMLILRDELYDILSKHSGKDIKKIEKDSDRDYWMKAEHALEYGIIDEVHVSNDNKVRAVTVKYRNANESISRKTFRAARSLVIILME